MKRFGTVVFCFVFLIFLIEKKSKVIAKKNLIKLRISCILITMSHILMKKTLKFGLKQQIVG